LVILVELRVRIDLHHDLATGVLSGQFLELERPFALRGVGGDDVAELDDDWGLGERRAGQGEGLGERKCRAQRVDHGSHWCFLFSIDYRLSAWTGPNVFSLISVNNNSANCRARPIPLMDIVKSNSCRDGTGVLSLD